MLFRSGSGRGGAVVGWAGPWPVDVRWWDERDHVRGVRWHIVCRGVPTRSVSDGAGGAAGEFAVLVMVAKGDAVVEALYD